MITHDYNLKVYYKDVDQMGVVYYARYFEFFEEARTELLKSLGLAITEIEKKGFFIPVVSARCDYTEGAKFEDNLLIVSSISSAPTARLNINYIVYRLAEKQLLAKGLTAHAFIDKKGVAKRPPKFFLDKFNFS